VRQATFDAGGAAAHRRLLRLRAACAMTLQEEIVAVQARIAKAQSERDTWRTSGMQEKYLEAYSLVEALELQLERLRQQGLRSFLKKYEPGPVSTLLPSQPPSASAAGTVEPDAPGERARLMAEFSIAYNGRHYQYGRYRYDHLADAVNYAKQRPMPPGSDGPGPMPAVEAPDESQRRLMAASAITFQDGVYHLGTYRYDRLADAVNYARLQRPEGS
jgi:hypothetical protein